MGLLNNPDFVQKMKDLLPPSEEPQRPASEISDTVSSPQFKQALQMFSSGLQSGQLGPLIREFGLGMLLLLLPPLETWNLSSKQYKTQRKKENLLMQQPRETQKKMKILH